MRKLFRTVKGETVKNVIDYSLDVLKRIPDAKVYIGTDYSIYVHQGTINMRARPFIIAAARKKRNACTKTMLAHARKGMKK